MDEDLREAEASVDGETSGTQQPLKEELNPMLNSVVLQTLFKHVPLEDIKVYRQVCRAWWKESLPSWRRESWIGLTDTDEKLCFGLPSFLSLSGESSSENSFQLENQPFRKYRLSDWNMDLWIDEQLKFWEQCGPKMTHLWIQSSTFVSGDDFDSILFQYAPNLEFLHLDGNHYNFSKRATSTSKDTPFDASAVLKLKELKLDLKSMYRKGKLPLNFFEIFRRYSKMTSLELSGTCYPGVWDGHTIRDVLKAMSTLRKKHGVQWGLENLNLLNMRSKMEMEFATGHTDTLLKLQFPLTSLSLDIGTETEAEGFKVILDMYAATLRKLAIFRQSSAKFSHFKTHREFPFGVQLGSLRDLRLFGGAVTPNLNFLQFTPKLRSLYLVHEAASSLLAVGSLLSDQPSLQAIRDKQERSNWQFFPYPMSVVGDTDFPGFEAELPYMEEFIVCGRHYQICSSREVESLTKLMPNLKKLRLGLGNDGFSVVCNAWKQLELLIIQPCGVDESGILGTFPGLNIQLPSLVELSRLRYLGFERGTNLFPMLDERDIEADCTFWNTLRNLQQNRLDLVPNALKDFQSKVPGCTVVSFDHTDEEWLDWDGGDSWKGGWAGPERDSDSETDTDDDSDREMDSDDDSGSEMDEDNDSGSEMDEDNDSDREMGADDDSDSELFADVADLNFEVRE